MTELVLALEGNEEGNITKMQMRVWSINNGTSILVRLLKLPFGIEKNLYNGKRTIGEVDKNILDLLENLKVISNKENWSSCPRLTVELEIQDEYEEKNNCLYYAFTVEHRLLKF